MNLKTKSLLAMAMTMASTMAAADYKVRCESFDHKYTECPISKHGYVRLQRQHSKSPCIQGRTWDFNKRKIWVDDACKATFIVEGRHHTNDHDDHKGEKAVAAVAGLALLAAAVKKSKDNDRDRYDDEEYHHGGHSSYMPNWMLGRFKGFNPVNHTKVRLNIKEDGKVKAKVGQIELTGYINDKRLYLGNNEFRIQRAGDGFNVIEMGNRSNVVHYTRND